jgi:hypothetical protein
MSLEVREPPLDAMAHDDTERGRPRRNKRRPRKSSRPFSCMGNSMSPEAETMACQES